MDEIKAPFCLPGHIVEPRNKRHLGNNNNIINSADLSPVERLSSSQRFSMYGNYREGNILEPEAVPQVERSNIEIEAAHAQLSQRETELGAEHLNALAQLKDDHSKGTCCKVVCTSTVHKIAGTRYKNNILTSKITSY